MKVDYAKPQKEVEGYGQGIIKINLEPPLQKATLEVSADHQDCCSNVGPSFQF